MEWAGAILEFVRPTPIFAFWEIVAAVIGALATAAGAAYSIYSSEAARDEQKKNTKKVLALEEEKLDIAAKATIGEAQSAVTVAAIEADQNDKMLQYGVIALVIVAVIVILFGWKK